MNLIYIVGIPAFTTMLVIVLTQSDLFRHAVSKLKGVSVMLPYEFEEYLMTLPAGFFLHKLWTCKLCQAFHVSWVSALAVYQVCPELSEVEAVLLMGAFFIGSLKSLSGGRVAPPPSEVGLAYSGEAKQTKLKESWPTPLVPYEKRVQANVQDKEGGGKSVHIVSIDELAQKAILSLSGDTKGECDYPRCRELLNEMEKEINAVKEKDPECTECALSPIKKVYINRAIALMGG